MTMAPKVCLERTAYSEEEAERQRGSPVPTDDWKDECPYLAMANALAEEGFQVEAAPSKEGRPNLPRGPAVSELVEHIHVHPPLLQAGAAGAGMWLAKKVGDEIWRELVKKINARFVACAKTSMEVDADAAQDGPRARRYHDRRILTIYGPDAKPVSTVHVVRYRGRETVVRDESEDR